jgi:hypothetical protein
VPDLRLGHAEVRAPDSLCRGHGDPADGGMSWEVLSFQLPGSSSGISSDRGPVSVISSRLQRVSHDVTGNW